MFNSNRWKTNMLDGAIIAIAAFVITGSTVPLQYLVANDVISKTTSEVLWYFGLVVVGVYVVALDRVRAIKAARKRMAEPIPPLPTEPRLRPKR